MVGGRIGGRIGGRVVDGRQVPGSRSRTGRQKMSMPSAPTAGEVFARPLYGRY